MLFTPTGAPALPAGWRHAQTYNYFKVAGAAESAVTVTTNRGLVAGTVAAYRGVDTRAGYLPGDFPSSAFPEYGGAAAAPGTYHPPDGSLTPKFTPGVCGFSLGPALANGSVAVATYQSESTDSSPVSPHYASAGTLVERWLSYASMVNPDTGNTDHFRLGFFDAALSAGVGTGNLYFGTTGTGGGERADTLQPYAGPVAWFSQLILSGAADRGPDLHHHGASNAGWWSGHADGIPASRGGGPGDLPDRLRIRAGLPDSDHLAGHGIRPVLRAQTS